MRSMRTAFFPLSLIALLGATGCAPTTRQASGAAPTPHSALRTPHAPSLPGKQADGSVLLPNLWSLRPVGKQVELGDFPINIAVHPAGRFVAVLHCGYSRHQILIIDIPAAQVVSHAD